MKDVKPIQTGLFEQDMLVTVTKGVLWTPDEKSFETVEDRVPHMEIKMTAEQVTYRKQVILRLKYLTNQLELSIKGHYLPNTAHRLFGSLDELTHAAYFYMHCITHKEYCELSNAVTKVYLTFNQYWR